MKMNHTYRRVITPPPDSIKYIEEGVYNTFLYNEEGVII